MLGVLVFPRHGLEKSCLRRAARLLLVAVELRFLDDTNDQTDLGSLERIYPESNKRQRGWGRALDATYWLPWIARAQDTLACWSGRS
jgi:hypothetical protein